VHIFVDDVNEEEEKERLRDLQERDEFAQRLKDKDKEKTKKVKNYHNLIKL